MLFFSAMPAFQLSQVDFHVLPMRTRFPFKYGIASMKSPPHLFVTARLATDKGEFTGVASEGLPPKWFTKDPATSFEEDLAWMLAVIQNAARIARQAAERPVSYFDWWLALLDEQKRWGSLRGLPPLLTNLGVSLVERAVLDGLCKASGMSLHAFLSSEQAGIQLGLARAELASMRPAQALAARPGESLAARHTVGLADPLRGRDIPEEERLEDGLPHALEDCIRAYGLRYFKIKVSGHEQTDLARLEEITRVLVENCAEGFHSTLDGNEQFRDLEEFRQFYEKLESSPALRPLFTSLLFIEQPLHRDHALKDEVAAVFARWQGGPGIIIDESDGSLDDLPRALELGYSGTSHKNCKGILKGLANAALLKKRGAEQKRPLILSAEDLVNIGPVALLQDLAMVSALGLAHVERNGHHYLRGLSMFPAEVQERVLRAHPGLYRRHEQGFAALNIEGGMLDTRSVNAAPFGCGITLDTSAFQPLNDWIKSGGMAALE